MGQKCALVPMLAIFVKITKNSQKCPKLPRDECKWPILGQNVPKWVILYEICVLVLREWQIKCFWPFWSKTGLSRQVYALFSTSRSFLKKWLTSGKRTQTCRERLVWPFLIIFCRWLRQNMRASGHLVGSSLHFTLRARKWSDARHGWNL